MTTRKRRALGAVSAVAALAITGGVAAQFTTSTASAPQQIGTGTLALTIDNVSDTVWTSNISNLAPGDSMQRFLDLRNSGSLKIAGINASQTNTLGDLLTAPSDISVKFESCTVAWNYTTGTCAGQQAVALDTASVRAWSASKAMNTFEDFGAGDVRHLKLTTTLAATATNAVQAKSGTITYTFGAAQRVAGTNGSTSDTAGALTQPSGVKTEVLSDTSVKVSFTDTNSGATKYVVNWGETGNSAVAPQTAEVAAGQSSYTVTGLTAGKSYDFTVAASKNGQTAATAPSTVTPKPASTPQVDLTNASWSSSAVASVPTNQNGAQVTTDSNGDIYVFGGSTAPTTVRKYTVDTSTWSQLADMPTQRYNGVAKTGADGMIYVIGGQNANGFLSSVDRYDPKTNTWSAMAAMPSARSYFSSVVDAQGNIYAIGGSPNGSNVLSIVDRYTPSTNSWTTLKSTNSNRYRGAAAIGNDGMIYVFGGYEGGGVVTAEKYNPTTNTWSYIRNMPGARRDQSAVTTADGTIYLVGGQLNENYSATVVKYNPVTNTYSDGPSLTSPRGQHATVKDKYGRLYVIGGYASGWTNSIERLG